MNFWDTSALTPLLIEEDDSALREAQLADDPAVLIWYGTPAEIQSALSRRRREGALMPDQERLALARCAVLQASWAEIEPTRAVRDRAIRLLRVHPLRAGDAFQLAAALVACAEKTGTLGFFTADTRLREAALAEGFRIG